MNTTVLLKTALSALVIGSATVGCTVGGSGGPATLSAVAPSPSKAGKAARQAEAALAVRKIDQAVRFAESAVAQSPRDPAYRNLLGQAYLLAGRFSSAEATFQDALTLSPDHPRVSMNLVLAQTALGKWDAARATLASIQGKVPESDRGLAIALAGDAPGAVSALEAAARAPGADAKTRQNLALAYALSGRWAESRATAAQDLDPNELPVRMRQWMLFAQPKSAWDQVAGLLGVTPVIDPGQPVALALAPLPAEAPAYASVAADPVPTPVYVAAPAAAQAIPTVAPVAPVVTAQIPASQPVVATEPVAYAVAEPAPLVQPAVAADQPLVATEPVRYALTETPAIEPTAQPVVATAPLPVAARRAFVTPKPAPSFASKPRSMAAMVKPRAPKPIAQSGRGKFVVQLGAYSNAARVEAAWSKEVRRSATLAGYSPSSASFAHSTGTVYRLTLAGFETRAEAVRICEQVRTRGGSCFVRASAGEQPIRWASRSGNIKLASR